MVANSLLNTGGIKKNFMFVCNKAPYGTIYALETLEMIMILAAFEQHAVIAFIDDGVFQIKKGHNTNSTGIKNFSQTYGVVAIEKQDADEDGGIDMVWRIVVEKESMDARGLAPDDFVLDIEVLNSTELSDLMAKQQTILTS